MQSIQDFFFLFLNNCKTVQDRKSVFTTATFTVTLSLKYSLSSIYYCGRSLQWLKFYHLNETDLCSFLNYSKTVAL